MKKIVRTICYFSDGADVDIEGKLSQVKKKILEAGFEIQTMRACIEKANFKDLNERIGDDTILLSSGTLSLEEAEGRFEDFRDLKNSNFNLELSGEDLSSKHVALLLRIIKECPEKTFNFTYVFNNKPNSPFFPSASFERKGFVIGLQPTDLAEDCKTLEDWFENMKEVWAEINKLFEANEEFLGIDTSIAPFFENYQSFIYFIKKLTGDFNRSFTTDIYTKVTNFIKNECPNPIGLCGLMFPCLEDAELAREYESGNFDIERNIYASLHSGLGIDTYPIGIDEKSERILEVLKLVQALSNKYKKPLASRFVSDGKSKIGEKSDFQNQYLYDVVIRKL